ncbi:hypothetical protein HID58_066252 [Brassica napus]|uniref:Uncharacterized protein n=1 Tax=Brassica napus TaxID=3708 RepID=A0ABQ7ZFK7_BRANA|nr:hypothetical protein HID58_066252 [Brassica napus]
MLVRFLTNNYFHLRWCHIQRFETNFSALALMTEYIKNINWIERANEERKLSYYMVSHQNQSICFYREYLQIQNLHIEEIQDIDQNVVSVQTHAFCFFNKALQRGQQDDRCGTLKDHLNAGDKSLRYALKGFTISIQVPQEPLYTLCEACFRPLKLSTRTTNWVLEPQESNSI